MSTGYLVMVTRAELVCVCKCCLSLQNTILKCIKKNFETLQNCCSFMNRPKSELVPPSFFIVILLFLVQNCFLLLPTFVLKDVVFFE